MDVLEAIFTRRSIRKYIPGKVTEEQLRIMLEAAMNAPSAGNQQPWQFIVIDDRKTLNKIQEFHPYSKMLTDAALAVLVCGDLSLEHYKNYWVLDCSAATQNLLLAAHGLGLGAVWLGIYPRENRVGNMIKLMELPEHIMPLALVSIGHPGQKPHRVDRYKKERIRFNKW